jgi:HD-like signal output (HDOD) protein
MGQAAATAEDRMQAVIAEIGAKGDFPAAARAIQYLNEAVGRDNCSALEVARVIHADPGLSSKVLRVVNSAFYRRRGEAVSTITRAVVLLGFEAVRDLTSGLLLLDEIARASHSSAFVRGVLQRCLNCAFLARGLSERVGYATPEEAYILGLFANWGILCLAAYYPRDFARARAAADAGKPLEDALADVFGFHPTTLAGAMLAHWSFPSRYVDYFRAGHSHHHPAIGPASQLFSLVSIAADYTAHPPRDEDQEQAPAVRRFVTLFQRTPSDFQAAARDAADAMRRQAPALGIDLLPDTPEPAAADAAPCESHAAADAAACAPAAPEASPAVAAGTEPAPELAAVGILAEVSRAILEDENINTTLSMVLEGVARTGHFDLVLLALVNTARDGLVGRLGYGEGLDEYLDTLAVPLEPGAGVLAETVLDGRARIVEDGSPALLVRAGAPPPRVPVRSFVTCPIAVHGKAIGVMLAARSSEPPVAPADLSLAELFATQAGLALAHAAR